MSTIVHVTEALGGGLAYSVSQLAQLQARDGWRVIVIHSIREFETPPLAVLEQLFPHPIQRVVIPMVASISPRLDVLGVVRLGRLFREFRPDVIHLHSSKGGVLGRAAARLTGMQNRCYYSPRGFAFLRQDVSPSKRRLYRLFEKLAGYLGGTLIACSESEANLGREIVKHARVKLVENSIQLDNIREAKGSGDHRVRIVTSGFINYAKAPWRFRKVATCLADEMASFVWIGDGKLKQELLVNGSLPDNLTITGWKARQAVLDELSVSDIFVMFSMWEGMPLALIEAQAAGLPAVVRDVVGCRDVVRNGTTGFVCASTKEVVEKLKLLIADEHLRKTMGANARAMALARFSADRMNREMLKVYGFEGGPVQH